MRIAVPMAAGKFSEHFGQSTGFWICDAELNPAALSRIRELTLPEDGGCGAIPGILAQAGVALVIAGGIGARAIENLQRYGIACVSGAARENPKQLVMQYMAGQLSGSGATCRHDHDADGAHEHAHHGNGGCHGAAR